MRCHSTNDSGVRMRGRKTEIRTDLHNSSALRALACGAASPRKVKRLLALANALDGMSFTAAAIAAGMERQALYEAAKRYNAEGVAGLEDRTRSGRQRRLDPEQEQRLAAIVLEGPDTLTGTVSRPLRSTTLPRASRNALGSTTVRRA